MIVMWPGPGSAPPTGVIAPGLAVVWPGIGQTVAPALPAPVVISGVVLMDGTMVGAVLMDDAISGTVVME